MATLPPDPLPAPAPGAAPPPPVEALPPARAGRLLAAMLAGALLALSAILLLPFSSYIAWQQAEGTDMFHARWIYERIRFDRAPIEVAVVGSSRLEAGISPRVLSAALAKRLGRPVPVANLSIVMPGRDFGYEIVRELLAHHPEVRLILLSDDGQVVNSHPLFRETASAREIVSAPLVLNTKYGANLVALPYRNIANLAQTLAPGWFGMRTQFSARDYLGTDLDRTLGYRLKDGTLINGEQHMPAPALAEMARIAVARQEKGLAVYRHFPPDQALAVDHAYVRRIARLAQEHGARLAFVALPLYGPVQSPGDAAFYRRFGPDIALTSLAPRADLFRNDAHLNQGGAVVASRLIAAQVAPLLPAARGLSPPQR